MTTFPENEVVLIPDYLGAGPDPPPQQTIQAITTALRQVPASIQERFPFKPFKPINQDAVARKRARLLLADYLERLAPRLIALQGIGDNLARQQFDGAGALLASMSLAPGPSITLADVQTATDLSDTSYEVVGGNPLDPTSITKPFPGYVGPAFDPHVLLTSVDFLNGGPERDLQLGLLQGEVSLGKRDPTSLLQAGQRFANQLPPTTTAPIDVLGVHVDLFQDNAGATQLTLSPRQGYAAIRWAFSYLELADHLFRTQRALNDAERNSLSAIYDAAVRLLDKCGVSADNPRRQEVQAQADLQKAKLQSGLNFIGLRDSFVPVQRASQLEQDAAILVGAAVATAALFSQLVDQLEQLTEEKTELQFQQQQEALSLQALDLAQQNATLSVDKIDEQIQAIDDQETALLPGALVGGAKSIIDGILSAKSAGGSPLGIVSGVAGLANVAVNFEAQSAELAHQKRMAQLERSIAANQVDIANLQRQQSANRLQFFAEKLAQLANRRHSPDFLYVLVELTRKRAERQLEAAIQLAYLFERAEAFFLGQPFISRIQFDYVDRSAKLEDAASALQEDFQLVLAERDAANSLKFDFFEQAISLRSSYPLEFARFLQTGSMDFVFSLYQLSKLRPAAHQCRLREVGVELHGLISPTGFSGTLTHRGRFLVRDRNATLDPGITRLIPTDADLEQALEAQQRDGLPVAAVGGVLFYDLPADTKELSQNTQFVSNVPPDPGTLGLFEGHAPTGLWHLDIQDHGTLAITDILLHFGIVSEASDIDLLQPKIEDLIQKYETELAQGDALDRISAFSIRQNFPDAFFALESGTATLDLADENFPAGLTDLRFKLGIMQAVDQQGRGLQGIGVQMSRPDAGFNETRVTRTDGFSEDLSGTPASLPPDQRFPVLGAWTLALTDPSQLAQLGDLRLFLMYAFDEVHVASQVLA